MTYAIPMQPKGFRRLRRLVWKTRCFLEYRRRLNGTLLSGYSNDPWGWSNLWQLAEASAYDQEDTNDPHGWAWDSPAVAVQNELEYWTE